MILATTKNLLNVSGTLKVLYMSMYNGTHKPLYICFNAFSQGGGWLQHPPSLFQSMNSAKRKSKFAMSQSCTPASGRKDKGILN